MKENTPDYVKKHRQEKELTAKAQKHLRKAREAEKEADPLKMSPEDRALYHYLQAVTTALEQDYDILLEAQQ